MIYSDKKYFSFILAALLLIAITVGTFIYQILYPNPNELEPVLLDTVNPAGLSYPVGPPTVPVPDQPPPSQ